MNGTVVIGPGFRHRAGLGGLFLPHPPVANWLLRRGLPEGARLDLNIRHESSHLQTLPLAFLYTAALAVFTLFSDHARGAETVLAIAGSFAGWEILSEVSAALGDFGTYRRAYRRVTPFPRLLFWSLMGAMASAPWYVTY